jgi:membrane protease YdiL (CAAX protease family)
MYNITNLEKKPAIIVGIILSVVLPFVAVFFSLLFKKIGISNEIHYYISRFAIWIALLLLFLFTLKVEKQPFLLWNEINYSFSSFAKALCITFIKLFVAVLITSLLLMLFKVQEESAALNKALVLFKKSYLLLFFTCVTAGITEELIFRGYLFPRLEIVLKNKNVALALSSILFGFLHIGYGTLFHVIGPTVIGFVFAFQYNNIETSKF